jgi:Holliday junction resolvase
MNINYRRGVALEYIVKKSFESYGFFVVRSAGSHSIADLVAIGYGTTYLVQCKAVPVSKVKRFEILELIKTCEKCGATPVLVVKGERGKEVVIGKNKILKLLEKK